MVYVRLFAGARIESDGRPIAAPATQRRRMALLALLAAHPAGISRERLAGYLWPDRDSEHARNLLSQSIHAVRRALGEAAVVATGDELRLDRAAVACDVVDFTSAIEAGELERAASLYAGPFLDGFFLPGAAEFEHWVEGVRQRYRRTYCAALETLATKAGAASDVTTAADWWRLLAAEDPGNARVTLGLMEALHSAGDRAGAIRQAAIHARLMEDELDARPDPEVMALAESLRRAPPGDVAATVAGPAMERPGDSRVAVSKVQPPTADAGNGTPAGPGSRPPPGSGPRPLVAAVVTSLVIAAGWLLWSQSRTPAHASAAVAGDPDVRRVVVLPFVNASDDPAQEYFSDGLTEELIAVLSQVHSLQIVARTSAFQYRSADHDAREIGRTLNAGWIVEGSVRREGERIRVWARLLDARSGVHLWSSTYERELADVFGIWADVAHRIATALEAQFPPDDRRRLTTRFQPAPEAHALYLRGRHFWKQRTAGAFERAIESFERAIEMEPRYADAWAGLALTHLLQSITGYTTPQSAERGGAAARHALELNEDLPEAWTALGGYLNVWAWDADAAEAAWLRAIELDPGYAYVHHLYAILLTSAGRFEEALIQRRKAVELDPLDPHLITQLARALISAGRTEEAYRHLRVALELDSLYWQAHNVLGAYADAEGRLDDAVRAHRRAVELAPGSWFAQASLARTLARAGRRDEAWRMLADLESRARKAEIFHPAIADVRAELDDSDGAIAWLELAYDQRHPSVALLKPEGPLAGDPRYVNLLRRTGRFR